MTDAKQLAAACLVDPYGAAARIDAALREAVNEALDKAEQLAETAKESELVVTAERPTAWYACDMIAAHIRALKETP